jgi:microcystin-dependent protein
MKTLNVMSMDFTYKAAIRGYESAILTRAWNGIGMLELSINSGIPNASLIQQDDLLWFDNDYHKAHIIEKIETTQDGSEKHYKITASHINALLRDYITIPPAGHGYDTRTGSREEIARAWVTENAIAPADPLRAQYPIKLGVQQGLGDTITEQTRLKVLSDEVGRILDPEDLGWRIELDIQNASYLFKVYAGVDRTASQSINGRILFGMKYGNVAGYRKITDSSTAKTVAYVGGQGEGFERNIIEVFSETAGRRKEAFIDARDTNEIPELTERGLQTLAEYAPVNGYEFEALNRQFTYETEYDLGDFVTVVMDKNNYQDLQIQKISEIYEQGDIRIVPEFGKPERTIGQAINAVSKKLEVLEAATPPGIIPPAGTVVATAAINVPTGWLECAGQAVSRSTYADLFAAIGTVYGSGNGTTTYNLPNLKGRIPVGRDVAQTEFDAIGEIGGNKTHTLTVGQLPSHTHPQRIANVATDGAAGSRGAGSANGITAGATDGVGSGEAHNNLQPYIVLRYMIKH